MSGRVVIRLRTDNNNGQFEAKILSHENGATCGDGFDETLIRDILESEIKGYEGLTQISDGGKTNEFFEEKKQKQGGCKIKDAPFGEDEEETKKEKDLSLGYGV